MCSLLANDATVDTRASAVAHSETLLYQRRRTEYGLRRYEAKYQFFQSKAVTKADELVKAGGWGPDGYGILAHKVTLSADGNSFDSRITLELFDKDGKPATGGGEGTATGQRLRY